MFNPLKYFRNNKVGLALGSGGSKGIAHISVIEYLESMNIPIDLIAGSSIGAIIGAIYCCGNLKKFKEDLLKINISEMFSIADVVFPKSGFLQGNTFIDFLKKYIPEDSNIEDSPIPLAIIATDFFNGNAVIFRSGNILEAIRASMSIPGVFVPVKYRGTYLLDGGVANPLPINVAKKMGAGITIAVNLHPRIHKKQIKKYVKAKMDKWGIMVDSTDIELIEEKTILDKTKPVKWYKSIENWLKENDEDKPPSIFEVMSQTVDIMEYINTALMVKYNSPSVLIEPDVLDVSTLDFSEASRIITEGYLACSKARNSILRNVKIWV